MSCFPFIRSGQNHLAKHSEREVGERRQGRQRKRWEDNIREWTGLEFTKYTRAVENRGKWTKLVVKSPVVPQQPLRLRHEMRWESVLLVDWAKPALYLKMQKYNSFYGNVLSRLEQNCFFSWFQSGHFDLADTCLAKKEIPPKQLDK